MRAKKIVNQSSDFPVRRTGSYRHKKSTGYSYGLFVIVLVIGDYFLLVFYLVIFIVNKKLHGLSVAPVSLISMVSVYRLLGNNK